MCGGKLSSTCGGKHFYATCVKYEGSISEYGKLENCDCHTVHEVLEDLTETIDEIYPEVFIKGLEDSCIEFEFEEDGKTVKNSNAIKALADKICEIDAIVNPEPVNDCETCIDPCDDGGCCESLVFYKYGSGEVQITKSNFGSWTPLPAPTYPDFNYVVVKDGNYKVTIDLGCQDEDLNAICKIGIGVNNSEPQNTPFTSYNVQPSLNSKTFHFIITSLKKGDTLKPLLKNIYAGVVVCDGMKIIIEKV